MLRRRTGLAGVVYYESKLLSDAGVPHAFSTRRGGVSAAPFDSLNLGNPSGCDHRDPTDNVSENYRLLLAAAGCGDAILCRLHQVHGATVATAGKGESFQTDAVKADALIGDDPRRVLSVRVADCVPVLLATRDARAVAAVHAGWRGVVAGVVPAAAKALSELAASRAYCTELLAAIGPCIGPEAFEVGPEVVAAFERLFDGAAIHRRLSAGKGLVDLRRAIYLQLLQGGIPAGSIESTDRCTHRDANEFFSHRRENGITGRMAALIRISVP